jgi:RNA recognition motif-containing protein
MWPQSGSHIITLQHVLNRVAAAHLSTAQIVMDRSTGKSKGYGFVTFPDDASARSAMGTLSVLRTTI